MSELQQLVNDLSNQLNTEKKAKELAQDEYARVQNELENKDYELVTVLNKQADIYASLIRLEKENKALKDLIKVWI